MLAFRPRPGGPRARTDDGGVHHLVCGGSSSRMQCVLPQGCHLVCGAATGRFRALWDLGSSLASRYEPGSLVCLLGPSPPDPGIAYLRLRKARAERLRPTCLSGPRRTLQIGSAARTNPHPWPRLVLGFRFLWPDAYRSGLQPFAFCSLCALPQL